PEVTGPAVVRAEAQAQVHERVAVDVQELRRRRARREVVAVEDVEAREPFARRAEEADLSAVLAAEARRPLRDARQPSARRIDRRRGEARELERNRRVRERRVIGVRIRERAGERERVAQAHGAIELDTARRDFLGARDDGPRLAGTQYLRLEVLDDGLEQRDIRCRVARRIALQPQFDVRDVLRRNRGLIVTEVYADRLERLRVGRVVVDAAVRLERERELTR